MLSVGLTFASIALDFVPHMENGTNVYLMGVSLEMFNFSPGGIW